MCRLGVVCACGLRFHVRHSCIFFLLFLFVQRFCVQLKSWVVCAVMYFAPHLQNKPADPATFLPSSLQCFPPRVAFATSSAIKLPADPIAFASDSPNLKRQICEFFYVFLPRFSMIPTPCYTFVLCIYKTPANLD